MDKQRIHDESGKGADIIHVGDGLFRIRSLSKPDLFRTVDLDRGFCSCPATVTRCRHRRIAEAALSVKAEYEITKHYDSRRGGFVYRVVEVIAGERTEITADLANYFEALMFREDVIGGRA